MAGTVERRSHGMFDGKPIIGDYNGCLFMNSVEKSKRECLRTQRLVLLQL